MTKGVAPYTKVLWLCFCFFMFTMPLTRAQVKLKKGDPLPDLVLHNVLNMPDGTIRLSNYRGKLLILDFWNHWCSSCIAGFPKLDSLQKRFPDQLQIVLVNRESKEATEQFFKKFKHITKPTLPMITGDSLLQNNFAVEFFPSHAWITEKGEFMHLASAYNSTPENLAAYFRDGKIELRDLTEVKRRYMAHAQYLYPDWDKAIRSYASITRWRDSFNLVSLNPQMEPNISLMHIATGPLSVLDLYLMAYNEGAQKFGYKYNTILQVKDSSRYVRPKDPNYYDKWLSENFFAYELAVDTALANKRYDFMKQDLERSFGLEVTIEKRWIKGWKLSQIKTVQPNNTGVPFTRGNYMDFLLNKDSLWRFKNMPASVLAGWMRPWMEGRQPFEVDIQPDFLISGSIPRSVGPENKTLDDLCKLLLRYGLLLKEQPIEREVLILAEKRQR